MVSEIDLNLTDADFRRVCEVVYDHCGISLDERKRDLVRARIAKQIRSGSFASAATYLEHAFADPMAEAFTQFIDSISTNLTSFFRERQHFDFLKATYLPRLLAKKKASADERLRVWSAACSTGEEPYSLAMTLLDAVNGPCTRDMCILATDISTRVLKVARAGIYREAQLANVPPAFRQNYFAPVARRLKEEQTFEVCNQLRTMVRFRHLNLMDAWPFSGPFDFIFCRNVMIYFDKPTQERIVARYWKCLKPGGLLFSGHSESLMGIKHQFVNVKPSIYEKRG